MKPYRKRVSVVVVHGGKVLGFNAEDPHTKKHYFFIPGGLIEDGETARSAAVRETLEETGYTIEIEAGNEIIRRYDFEWNGTVYDCETIFLSGRLIGETSPVSDAPYHRGAGWVSVKDISSVFGYHPDILEPVLEISRRFR